MRNIDTKTVTGTYGGLRKTQCEVFVYEGWYVVKGSQNVNFTLNDIESGINVEAIFDIGTFTSPYPINSIEDLVNAVDS